MNNARKAAALVGAAVLGAFAFVPDMLALSSGNPYKPSPAIESKVDALVQRIRDRVSPLDQTRQKAFFDSFDRKLGGLRAKFSQKKEVLALLNGIAYETDALRKSLSSWGEAGLLEDLMGSVDSADASGNVASGGDGAASSPSSPAAAKTPNMPSCEKKTASAQEFSWQASRRLGQGMGPDVYPGYYLRGIPANEHWYVWGIRTLWEQLILSAWAQDVEFKKGTWADWETLYSAVPTQGTVYTSLTDEERRTVEEVFTPLFRAWFNLEAVGKANMDELKYGYDWIGALRTFLSDERVAAVIRKQAAKEFEKTEEKIRTEAIRPENKDQAMKMIEARWKAYDCFLGKNVSGRSW